LNEEDGGEAASLVTVTNCAEIVNLYTPKAYALLSDIPHTRELKINSIAFSISSPGVFELCTVPNSRLCSGSVGDGDAVHVLGNARDMHRDFGFKRTSHFCEFIHCLYSGCEAVASVYSKKTVGAAERRVVGALSKVDTYAAGNLIGQHETFQGRAA
jgi:hypothetical protein